jgi:hypothetical protein
MEFGLFLNGYIPGPAAHDSEMEHLALMREAAYVVHADKHHWKYAWFGEHHSLTEYSQVVPEKHRTCASTRARLLPDYKVTLCERLIT